MSIAMSVIVVEGVVILRLLLLSMHHRRAWKPVANFKLADVDGLRAPVAAKAGYGACADSSCRASASEAAHPQTQRVAKNTEGLKDDRLATHARRLFTAPGRTKMSARTHRVSLDGGWRPPTAEAFHASDVVNPIEAAYFQKALESLPIAILIVDQQGVIVMVNTQTAKYFGYGPDELIGESLERLLPDFGRDSGTENQGSVFSGVHEKPVVRELSAKRKDGTSTYVEIGTAAFPFDSGLTLAFIVDRMDRYELHRNRRDLAHLTRVSTIGQLASSLAHELNQPLTAILSNVQAAQRFMMSDPIDLAEVRDILNDIVQDDYRASEVIRRIRAVVKNGDLEVMPLDLAEVIRDAVVLMHSDAISRGLRVRFDLDQGLPPVQGDKVQLQQVVLNLLLNAFDAMEGVQPADRVVDVKLKPEQNGMVGLAVIDRGHGLAPERLGKIFKPFFTSKPQGLGLGLSISRSIVEMHRGRLWAENNIDRGATFHVTLPVGNVMRQDGSR
ncbi:MAG: two-component system, LuxR family, sensor kinase FixL [Paraburkholderia sp.]|nr:two-component system, LuxR family, sensor kinase FixL [Paraburkholderia sp.]